MIDIKEYAKKYYESLREILKALPKDAAIPPYLNKTSFIIGYSDKQGKFGIQLLSREKVPEIELNGKIIKPKLKDWPSEIFFENIDQIENYIFPQDNKSTSVSMTINSRNTTLNGLAFSSKQYNDKYWSDAKFYRNCAGDIPFIVTEYGTMLGINILWGAELGGVREEKVFEFIKLFGSEDVLPTSREEMQNETFRDFGHAAANLGEELDDWSFTDFILGLEVPVERNVLLLGSYKSNDEFEHLRTILGELGYRGFLLKDSPDLPIQSNLEKLLTAIICSCFIIVLDKDASGHIAELGNMLQFRFRPVIVLRDRSEPTTAFLEDQILTDTNFRVVVEQNLTTANLLPHIKWARSISDIKTENFNVINSWRNS